MFLYRILQGPFNNQLLINFLQSLIFPCGTYLGHLLQKFAKIESI